MDTVKLGVQDQIKLTRIIVEHLKKRFNNLGAIELLDIAQAVVAEFYDWQVEQILLEEKLNK